MKICVVVASVLVLSSFLDEVQGIRFVKSSISERHDQKLLDKSSEVTGEVKSGVNTEAVVCKGAHCSSAGTKKARFSRAVKRNEPHHWLPTIHEDYYGPKIHNPRHH